METNCKNCGSLLTGRQGKKFCTSACKNDYHNTHLDRDYSWKKHVVEVTRKNHRILYSFEQEGVLQIADSALRYAGFNEKGLTGVEMNPGGTLVIYCYEYELCRRDDKWLLRNLDREVPRY